MNFVNHFAFSDWYIISIYIYIYIYIHTHTHTLYEIIYSVKPLFNFEITALNDYILPFHVVPVIKRNEACVFIISLKIANIEMCSCQIKVYTF